MATSLFIPATPGAALTPGQTPEPSLSSRAMLSGVSISTWSGRKYDREASEEIATLHGAQPSSGRYNKLLLEREAFKEINKIVGETRQQHYYMTLPWSDNGYRVLPAAAYMEHTEKMRRLSHRFSSAVDNLLLQYEQLVSGEKIRLGTLFKAGDYPGITEFGGKVTLLLPGELRSHYSFETKVLPLPDAGDFRVHLGDEEKDRVKRQIAASIEASLHVASRDLWQRLYDAVTKMAERLKAYKVTDDGVENAFRDTLVTNLVKLLDVLPKLNVMRDANFDRLAEQVRATLVVDPTELRASESVRNDTAMAAAAIAQQMAGYMCVYPPPSTAVTLSA